MRDSTPDPSPMRMENRTANRYKPGRNHRDAAHLLPAQHGGEKIFRRDAQRHQVDAQRDQKADQAADDPAQKADGAGLAQEEHPHVGDVAAQRFHHADLPGALRDGHDHGVGDAQRRHDQGDGAQPAQHQLFLAGLLLHGFADALHGFGVVAQLPDGGLHRVHLADVPHLDQQRVVGRGGRGGAAGRPLDQGTQVLHPHQDAVGGLVPLGIVLPDGAHRLQGQGELALLGLHLQRQGLAQRIKVGVGGGSARPSSSKPLSSG